MVHSIKMGWMKPKKEKSEEEKEEEDKRRYDLWADNAEDSVLKRFQQRIPAPKTPLPGHVESYNPPPEYLFTKQEVGGLLFRHYAICISESLYTHIVAWTCGIL